MSSNILSSVAEQQKRLIQAAEQSRQSIGQITTEDSKYPSLDTELPDVGLTIGQLHARVEIVSELLTPLAELSPSALLALPLSKFSALPPLLSRTSDKFISLSEQIRTFEDFVTTDENAFIFSNSEKTKSINLAVSYTELSSFVDDILVAVLECKLLAQQTELPTLGDAVKRIGSALSELTDTEYNATLTKDRIESSENKISELCKSATQNNEATSKALEEIDLLLNKTKKHAEDIEKIKNETDEKSTTLIGDIENISSNAEQLRDRVENYSESFQQFDNALSERENALDQGDQKLQNLIAQLNEKNEVAIKLISDAKEALGWTTVQGLTLSFSTSAERLDEPVKSATTAVYISMLFFAVWVLAVFVLVPWLDPSLQLLRTPNNLQGWAVPVHILTNLGVRLTIIAPAFLFFLFSMNRYRNFSNLRDQYQFKKTIAAAIPGFKEQAAAQEDPHAKAMTLAAFERLLFNPVDPGTKNFDGRRGGGWLSRQLVRIVSTAISEAQEQGLPK